jgi:hypothetical protein
MSEKLDNRINSDIDSDVEVGAPKTEVVEFDFFKIIFNKAERVAFKNKLERVLGLIREAKKNEIKKFTWEKFLKENGNFFKSIDEIEDVLASFVKILNMNLLLNLKKIKDEYKTQEKNINKVKDNFSKINSFLIDKYQIDLTK